MRNVLSYNIFYNQILRQDLENQGNALNSIVYFSSNYYCREMSVEEGNVPFLIIIG